MPELIVPKHQNYDDFRTETERAYIDYLPVAAAAIYGITPNTLRAQAMVHPDGFLKVQIGPEDGARDGQVRLHFWIPGRKGTEQPHSHPWHLASFVLAGTYREYQPDMQVTTDGLNEYRVLYPSGRDVRAGVERVGKQSFACERGELYETTAGGSHFLGAGPTHMSSPDGTGGITLAVMSPRFADEAHFFAFDDAPYQERITDEDVTAVMGLIRSVRADL